MKIGPLFKHFGSKWSGAKNYPPPEHDAVFEPFAGGAGYSLNYPEKRVTIWEEDYNLQVLWTWLITYASEGVIRSIPLDVPEGTDIRSLGMSLGASLLLKHWQRTNNCGNCWTVSAWGSKPGQWTANTRSRVAEQVSAVKHWRFAPVTYGEVGTYFLDPPYLYNYRYRFPTFDFAGLVRNVQCIPSGSLIIACEAECPKTGYRPDYLRFAPSHSQVTSRRKEENNHHSKELVYIERRV